MTNTKAITTIKNNYPPVSYTMLREVLDLAIEALEHYEDNKGLIEIVIKS